MKYGNLNSAVAYYLIINDKKSLAKVADAYLAKGNYEQALRYYEDAGNNEGVKKIGTSISTRKISNRR